MAVYRESSPIWRRNLALIIGVILVVIVIVIAAVLLTRGAATPTPAGPAQTGGALDVIAQSLDLFGIEYPKVTKGTPPAQTGAPGAIDRALETFNSAAAALHKIDAKAADTLGSDLTAFKAALSAPSTNVDNLLAEVNAQLVALRKASAG